MNIVFKGTDYIPPTPQGAKHESFVAKMDKSIDNEVVRGLLSDIENADSDREAVDILLNAAEEKKVEQLSGNYFKSGNYYILNLYKFDAVPYAAKMKKLSDMKLGIVPELVSVISKDNEYFIVSKIDGCESGDLIPFNQIKDELPKDSMLAAYKDLQKITKAGLTDTSNTRSVANWYVAPDNNRIVLPAWNGLRPLDPVTEKNTLGKYYQLLFNQKD